MSPAYSLMRLSFHGIFSVCWFVFYLCFLSRKSVLASLRLVKIRKQCNQKERDEIWTHVQAVSLLLVLRRSGATREIRNVLRKFAKFLRQKNTCQLRSYLSSQLCVLIDYVAHLVGVFEFAIGKPGAISFRIHVYLIARLCAERWKTHKLRTWFRTQHLGSETAFALSHSLALCEWRRRK